MKRFITVLLLIAMSMASFAKTEKNPKTDSRISAILNEYKGKEGFEIMQLGSFGTSALKTIMKASLAGDDSEETRMILKAMKGVKKMAIAEYKGCSEELRAEFCSKIGNVLDSSELLIDVSDSNDVMKVYGVVNESQNAINDFIIYAPNECALICMFGSIPMDFLETAME